jgi:hypothetical protein
MAEPQVRLSDPLFNGEPEQWGDQLPEWTRRVVDEMNALPVFSIFSTENGPGPSGVTASVGAIGVDLGSSSTTHLWIGESAGTTGWKGIG